MLINFENRFGESLVFPIALGSVALNWYLKSMQQEPANT
jgi:hypothetical protein